MQGVHSIIAFSPNSTFKFKKEFTSAHVIQFPDLLTTIRRYKEQRISEATVKGINEKLAGLLVVDKSDKKRVKAGHMQSVRKAKDTKQTTAKNVTMKAAPSNCPRCEGQLTLKAGR